VAKYEDIKASPVLKESNALRTIVTSSLRCTSGPTVNPADKENRPTKKITSAPFSIVDLAEQKLIKDFRPASELPSHLHLLEDSDNSVPYAAYDPKKNYLKMFWRSLLENEQMQTELD
jgi:hypothetical protein